MNHFNKNNLVQTIITGYFRKRFYKRIEVNRANFENVIKFFFNDNQNSSSIRGVHYYFQVQQFYTDTILRTFRSTCIYVVSSHYFYH